MVDRSYFDDLDRARVELVDPVLDALLQDGELDSVLLEWASDPFATASGELLTIRIRARGEELQSYLWSPDWGVDETKKRIRRRLAGDVEDFVAESRFAWGQQRMYLVEDEAPEVAGT